MAKGRKAEELLPMLFRNSSDLIEATFESEERHQNPLSKNELDTLKKYTNIVQNGGKLTLQQAKEFEAIAQKLANEKPDDQGAFVLLLLAALMLGMLIGSSK